MSHLSIDSIIAVLICFFGGGGIVWIVAKSNVKETAKEALKEDIDDLKLKNTEAKKEVKDFMDELKKADEGLHGRINTVEKDFVRCEFCKMQHSNLDKNFENINSKLDILIDNATK